MKDMTRAVAILKGAARDLRKVALRATAQPAANRNTPADQTAVRKRAAPRPIPAKAVSRKAKARLRSKAGVRRSR